MKSFKVMLASLIAVTHVAYAFDGDATWYNTGLGSCGVWNNDSDLIVAISTPEAAGGVHCGQIIRVYYQDRIVDATIQDTCPGCSQYSIDLSPAAFQQLAPLEAGRIQVHWEYI